MKEQLQLKNHLKDVRTEANLSQAQLAEMVGVSRNTISSIETGQFNPTAKLALIDVYKRQQVKNLHQHLWVHYLLTSRTRSCSRDSYGT